MHGIRHEVQEVLVEGDVEMARVVVSGTFASEFGGLPGTGHAFRIDQSVITHLRDGRIAEAWEIADIAALQAQSPVEPQHVTLRHVHLKGTEVPEVRLLRLTTNRKASHTPVSVVMPRRVRGDRSLSKPSGSSPSVCNTGLFTKRRVTRCVSAERSARRRGKGSRG